MSIIPVFVAVRLAKTFIREYVEKLQYAALSYTRFAF